MRAGFSASLCMLGIMFLVAACRSNGTPVDAVRDHVTREKPALVAHEFAAFRTVTVPDGTLVFYRMPGFFQRQIVGLTIGYALATPAEPGWRITLEGSMGVREPDRTNGYTTGGNARYTVVIGETDARVATVVARFQNGAIVRETTVDNIYGLVIQGSTKLCDLVYLDQDGQITSRSAGDAPC